MFKKRNVAYVKPQEPSFLTKLKKEAGYVEGPTVDTKREELPVDSDSDTEKNEEKPIVVVLKDGDLTAEEADKIKEKEEIEKATAPADLSERIIFQPSKSKRNVEESETDRKKPKKSKKDVKKQLLSFDQGDEDEDN